MPEKIYAYSTHHPCAALLPFQSTGVVAIYLIAMVMLGLHLYHGIWSMTQTLGIDNPEWNPKIRLASKALAIIVSLGFAAVPLGAAFGLFSAPV